MQQYITAHAIANEIRMLRSVFPGAFLIVEGDIDARIYGNFISDECQIKIAFNKASAVDVISILNKDNFLGALAVVDADFDVLDEKEQIIENLFLTDFHDIECLIFISPALEKVLVEFGSEAKIKKFGKNVREYLFEIGTFVGYLRWLSLSEGMNLTFEGLDFGKFINKDGLDFSLESFITTVKNKSLKPELDSGKIAQKIENLIPQNYDKKQVSCGKDLVEILTLGLKKTLGTKSKENPIEIEIIGKGLRLAYEFDFFATSELYQSVKMWEKQNLPFKVFR